MPLPAASMGRRSHYSSSSSSFFLFSVFLCSLSFHGTAQTPPPTDEQQILLTIKREWQDPAVLGSWSTSNGPHCSWEGITCAGGSVVGISLSNYNITAPFPPSICNLRNLTRLDLSWNYLPGDFPASLYNCAKLEYLDISQNYFVGNIPSDIDKLSSTLRYLNLSANNFSGDIPPAIGRLSNLVELGVYQTLLNGTLPVELGDLSNLEFLGLAYLHLPPTRIPSEFARLKKLKFLWMTHSNLIGEIPDALSNLTELEQLDLADNQLSGKIPDGLFQLKNLQILSFQFNRLSGEIPKSMGALNLTQLDISGNQLRGSIPEEFSKLQNLELLYLYYNRLSGPIPPGIARLPNLTGIRLFNNSLTGELPRDLGAYSPLLDFQVSVNRLTGTLPENLCKNGTLENVIVFSNNLTGTVPESLGSCKTLMSVQLYKNQFSGEIPAGIWSLMNLNSLMIGDNFFTGELPDRLGPTLGRLEIANNKFAGRIPSHISASSNLTYFTASNNNFSGQIPPALTALGLLNTLNLDGNQISGDLPAKIISWRSLTILNMRNNRLTGSIPTGLASLSNLNSLDLSENLLSGEIPAALGGIRFTYLNLSANRLSGPIPGELQNRAYEDSFLENSGLCADHPSFNVPPCLSGSGDSSKISPRFLALILVLSALISLAGVGLAFFVVRDYRRRRQSRELASWKLTSFQRLDFNESSILKGLTEANLIGKGGGGRVYRIALGRGGSDYVAVKRISNGGFFQDENLEKEFLVESRILGSIRHANIVKLLCCISSENAKLLVYEYMDNGSLDQWLHGKRKGGCQGVGSLDWPTRHNIAVGAAQGLCYMHHACSPPIVHRDVKSSNILLDSEFKARMADFGVARLLEKPGQPVTVSNFAGSFGYMAPECAYTTRVSEKSDVFSFGVVLLELVTGREAHDGGEHTCLTEWAWKHFQDRNSVEGALDKEVQEQAYVEGMSTVFKLGLLCTSSLPSARPPMKEVVQILRRCEPSAAPNQGRKKDGNEYDVTPLLYSPHSGYKRSNSCSQTGEDDHKIATNV